MNVKRGLRRTGFHGLRLLARLLSRSGMTGLRRHGHRIGLLHYRFNPRRRKRLAGQIMQALDTRPGPEQATRYLREAYRVNDRAILELLAMYSGAVNVDDIAQSCEIRRIEHLDSALSAGKGVVMLGMHMGNGVAMATHLARRGYPMAVIYREAGKIAPNFFRDGIGSLGLEAIPAEPASVGVRRMLKALKANRILFILMDQATKKGGIRARFLGKDMQMPPGPAELARRTGAAVVPALLEGVEPAWCFRMGEPVWLDASRTLNDDVQFLTQIMQSHIESQPQWWTWHQRRWSRYAFPDQSS